MKFFFTTTNDYLNIEKVVLQKCFRIAGRE